MLDTASPNTMPLQGRSDWPGAALRRRCMASRGTAPHSSVPLGSLLARMVATAEKYLSIRLS